MEAAKFEVLRFTANTRIEYIPGAKRPGSICFERYAKYSQAKNVSEALELGSWVPDLVHDYEKKLLKVVGGPLRDKPLEAGDLVDPSQTTETDKALSKLKLKSQTTRTSNVLETSPQTPVSNVTPTKRSLAVRSSVAPLASGVKAKRHAGINHGEASAEGQQVRTSCVTPTPKPQKLQPPQAEKEGGTPSKKHRAEQEHGWDASAKSSSKAAGDGKRKADLASMEAKPGEGKRRAELVPRQGGEFEDKLRDREDDEEPADSFPEVSPTVWRLLAVRGSGAAADLASITFDPAADTRTGVPLLAQAMELVEGSPSDAGLVLVNFFRRLVHQARPTGAPSSPPAAGACPESELVAGIDALLPSPPVKKSVIVGAVENAFHLRLTACDKIANAALEGRKKQATLSATLVPRGVLTLTEVMAARVHAKSSAADDVRKGSLTTILAASQAEHRETRWLVRLMQGKMLCGYAAVLHAVAQAVLLSPQAGQAPPPLDNLEVLLETFSKLFVLGYGRMGGTLPFVRALLRSDCSLASIGAAFPAAVGVPIRPMLAPVFQSKTKLLAGTSPGLAAVEWCYQGKRVQVHVQGGEVRAFGTDLQECTGQIGPQLMALLQAAGGAGRRGFIVDAIIQGVTKEKEPEKDAASAPRKAPGILDQLAGLPQDDVDPEIAALEAELQALKKRRREQEEYEAQRLIAFDLLWSDTGLLTGHCFRSRREQLREVLKEHPPRLTLAQFQDCSAEELHKPVCTSNMMQKAVLSGTATGLILKPLDSPYVAGCRPGTWQILTNTYRLQDLQEIKDAGMGD